MAANVNNVLEVMDLTEEKSEEEEKEKHGRARRQPKGRQKAEPVGEPVGSPGQKPPRTGADRAVYKGPLATAGHHSSSEVPLLSGRSSSPTTSADTMKAFVCAVLMALLVAVAFAAEEKDLKGSEAVYVASPYAATYGYYGYPYAAAAYRAAPVVSAYSAYPYAAYPYYYR
ncbi:uncharacterized protein LOC124606552 [Schistocerca americana]|uniref:uncharacterized protein LOC124606552 n=1 Tax=Schistocerca americana TaxID=7009 RepID=UPI001F4F1B44|nr:uncharacterized protein LOC124606552 [Schistocerca americana]